MSHLLSFIGLFILLGIAYFFSVDRKKIKWRPVVAGVLLQLFLGFIILKTSFGKLIFNQAKVIANQTLNFTQAGSDFIFGSLANPERFGFIFFTMVLPTIIFVSALMSVLYHLGIMQKVVGWTARVMMKTMGTSGAESLATAANIFAGQTEAPLVVKPYVNLMTKSELMALMTGGFATVAGGVLAAYVGMGIDAGHLLAASVMSAPAALACAKLLVPETEVSKTAGTVKIQDDRPDTVNLVDAAASGAGDGLKLALNVGAMLLAFIALIAMINGLLGFMGGLVGFPQLSFELISGYVFSPLAFFMGVPWEECLQVGSLLGKKLVVNEFVGYMDLQVMIEAGTLSERSIIVSTYAMCGFANFSSIAIQLGGLGTIAPKRKKELAQLGMRALLGGTLACQMTACIAGLMI